MPAISFAETIVLIQAIDRIILVIHALFRDFVFRRRAYDVEGAVDIIKDAARDDAIRKALKGSECGRRVLGVIEKSGTEVAALVASGSILGRDIKRVLYEARIILEEHRAHAEREAYYRTHGHYPGEGHLKRGAKEKP